jgi:hypothetical protein
VRCSWCQGPCLVSGPLISCFEAFCTWISRVFPCHTVPVCPNAPVRFHSSWWTADVSYTAT